MSDNIHLLLIDAQNSFVKHSNEYKALPGGHIDLCVEGAEPDMLNVTAMMKKHGKNIKDVHATLDSHHPIHIASPVFWLDRHGNHPNPFTLITVDDVKKGIWRTTKPSLQQRGLAYVEALAANGRYILCMWPPHCIIGTEGHAIYQPLREALYDWEVTGKTIDFLTKGSNPFTEHYSGVQADVQDPADPTSQLNTGFINTLVNCDYLLLAGEALNFCMANTVTDIANNVSPDLVKKFVLLEDCTSAVKGFEHLTDAFLNDMKARGMQISDSKNFF